MRIALFEHDFESVGGRQDDAIEHARLLAHHGHQVIFACLLGREVRSRYKTLEADGVRLCSWVPEVWPDLDSTDLQIAWHPSLAHLLGSDRPSLVRVIAPDRIDDTFLKNDHPLRRYSTNSVTMQALLHSRFPGTAGRSHIMPSLVDYKMMVPYGQPAKGRDFAATWIGYRTTYSDGTDKGWEMFARFAAERPHRRFVAISTDVLDRPAPPPNVAVLVEVSRATVGEYLGRSHLLIVPSKVESAPNAVVEALAAGAWPVALRRGAIPELLGGLGDLVEDEEALVRAADHALERAFAGGFEVIRQGMIEQALSWDQVVWGPRALSIIESMLP